MKPFIRSLVCLTALACAPAWCDEEPEESVAPAEKPLLAKPETGRLFSGLPLCRRFEGIAQVLVPGETEWKAIEDGKFYPLGTAYRTGDAASRLTISFGPAAAIEIEGKGSFTTRLDAAGAATRTILLGTGKLTADVPANFPDGAFTLTAPGFSLVNLAGRSEIVREDMPDGFDTTVTCVTGTLAIEGPNFRVVKMDISDVLRLRTTNGNLFTGLYGVKGECLSVLEQGLVEVKDFETGVVSNEMKTLEWRLSPRNCVRIHRLASEVGERRAVSTMTFDAAGALVNRCTFVEGRASINSGEVGPANAKKLAALKKKADEAAGGEPAEEKAATEEDAPAEEEASDTPEPAKDDEEEIDF